MRFSLKTWSNAIVPFLCIVFLLSTPCTLLAKQQARSITVVVTGTGNIEKEDDASAREEAIAESLVTAVGLAMAEIMPLELLVSNFQTLNEILYFNTDRFINGYRVLTETKYKNLYRVVVQVRVSTFKIRKQLSNIGILLDKKKVPRLLLLIAEQNLEDILPQYWWQVGVQPTENKAETILKELFKKKGFIVTKHRAVPQFSEDEINLDTPEPDDNTAVALGSKFNADIVIIGRAFADQTQNTMGEELRSFKGTVTARAIEIKTGKEIAKTFQTDISVNADDIEGGHLAVSRACTMAGEDLALQMTAAFEKTEKKSTKIKITVQGTNYLSNFVKFRKTLNDIQNVKGILTSEMKSDEATIIVSYKGDTKSLAQALMLKSFDTFGINISKVTEDYLKIELIHKIGPSALKVNDSSE